MTLRTLSLGWLVFAAGCRCGAPPLGPLEDVKPASLPDTGILVEQPADGATVDAEWVTVTGWVDRSRYAFVAVVGAPSPSFYAATGHMGVPSVPVMVRDDGRFIAPRVPLAVGKTDLLIIALTPEGTAGAQADRSVNSGSVFTPATLVVDPPEGGRAPLDVTFEPHAGVKVEAWQWDYDGDGHFDEEQAVGKHRYTQPGAWLVSARTRIGGQWVMTVAPVQVLGDDDITHQSSAVTAPRSVTVVPEHVDVLALDEGAGDALLASDPMHFTRAVLVTDGDGVKVFDSQLHLVRTLTGGLHAPAGAAQDELGRTWVADTGNNRVVRFDANGALDLSFADAGSLTEVRGEPITSPTTVLVESFTGLDGGLEVGFSLATGKGRVDCKGLGACSGPAGPIAERYLSTASAFGGTRDAWFLQGGQLLRGDDLSVRSRGTDALDGARGTISSNPWWAVLHPDGRLEEHFSKVSNVRVTRLGFPATALAVDGSADYLLRYQLGDDASSRVTGPHVLYLAGPGHLERRVLPQMGEGLW